MTLNLFNSVQNTDITIVNEFSLIRTKGDTKLIETINEFLLAQNYSVKVENLYISCAAPYKELAQFVEENPTVSLQLSAEKENAVYYTKICYTKNTTVEDNNNLNYVNQLVENFKTTANQCTFLKKEIVMDSYINYLTTHYHFDNLTTFENEQVSNYLLSNNPLASVDKLFLIGNDSLNEKLFYAYLKSLKNKFNEKIAIVENNIYSFAIMKVEQDIFVISLFGIFNITSNIRTHCGLYYDKPLSYLKRYKLGKTFGLEKELIESIIPYRELLDAWNYAYTYEADKQKIVLISQENTDLFSQQYTNQNEYPNLYSTSEISVFTKNNHKSLITNIMLLDSIHNTTLFLTSYAIFILDKDNNVVKLAERERNTKSNFKEQLQNIACIDFNHNSLQDIIKLYKRLVRAQ